MLLSAGTRLGPYEIAALLGSGGMGEVYRAQDTKLGRDVAIKVLPAEFARDPQRVARFEREARVLASLNHPNIAAIYGFEQLDGVSFLVLEYVPGECIKGQLAVEDALPVARQIAEAVEYAHEKGIIHRDLKPANIKITPQGAVKVLDFGLAKALEDDPGEVQRGDSPTLSALATRAGMILGTAGYMSPEQAKGKRVDRRADIWAFGIVLLEMLTGKPAYAGENAAETLAFVMTRDPGLEGLPAATPAAIRKLLGRCLERDPRRRLQAIGEARIVLEAPEEETGSRAEDRRGLKPAARLAWSVAAAASLAAAALAIIHFRQSPPPERTLRYWVAPPEKASIQSFALSPDGRYLAISASQAGKRRLWVRPLDSLEPQALSGADDAMFPFWSPDSRWIGFFAQGKLKKIASTGGPPQTLCDAPQGRGGTWNRDGLIVFTPAPRSALYRVPAAGGVPAPVTQVAAYADDRYPIFLPDGRRFLYQVLRRQEKGGIHVASLDSKDSRQLLPDNSAAVYAPPAGGNPNGHLLFLREGTLMAQPLDPKTLQPAADLFPVAEQVPRGANNSAPISISGNGLLVYLSGGSIQDAQLAWFDRNGKPLGNVGAPGLIRNFALSPDGKRVALTRGDIRASDLWLHELERSTEARFTFHASANSVPVWSPDGARIAFASNRGGVLDLYQKSSSGAGQEELLLQSRSVKLPAHWSRDGRFLVYSELAPKTRWDLWVLPLEGDRKPVPYLQTEFAETQGQISPDGKWMAYTSDESGRSEIYVQPFPRGSGPEGKWKVSTAGGTTPRWRPDGKELYYLDADDRLTAVAVKGGTAFAVGAPEPLFTARTPEEARSPQTFDYDLAADGKRFLVRTTREQAGEQALVVVVNWQKAIGGRQ